MARNPIIREHSANVPVSPEETPHGCYAGWVFLGFEGEDEQGRLPVTWLRHRRPRG
jgi:hypothetical protein